MWVPILTGFLASRNMASNKPERIAQSGHLIRQQKWTSLNLVLMLRDVKPLSQCCALAVTEERCGVWRHHGKDQHVPPLPWTSGLQQLCPDSHGSALAVSTSC